MRVEAAKLYDDIIVRIVDPGDSVPAVCGYSNWDREDREDCVPLDPEEFQVGEVKEARNPSNVVRDSHDYTIRCEGIEEKGEWVIGIFDVIGEHSTDSSHPEFYTNRKLWVVVKMKEEILEQKRDALKRHLIGLLKTISV